MGNIKGKLRNMDNWLRFLVVSNRDLERKGSHKGEDLKIKEIKEGCFLLWRKTRLKLKGCIEYQGKWWVTIFHFWNLLF